MARDHALAAALPHGRAAVRLYLWNGPTLSLGRNEPTEGVYAREALASEGLDVVRRPTGGRAVVHHRELTYAVVVPLRALGGPRAAYRAVNGAMVQGLSLLGVNAEIAPGGGSADAPDAGPCFASPAAGEVTAGGRKLVGSAQARIGEALLQHGSILLDDDQGRLPDPAGRLAGAPPATLAVLLGAAPPPGRVVEAVLDGFRAALPGSWDGRAATLPPELERELEERYRSPEWTWRR